MKDVSGETGEVYVCDTWRSGFNIRPHDIRMHPDTRMPASVCRDLLLTRPNVNYAELCETTLFSVNGLLYPGNATDNGICLKGAFKPDGLKTNSSLLRFQKIGKLKIQPITEEIITTSIKSARLKDMLYVNLPEKVNQYPVFAVIGGHLHLSDSIMQMVSSTKVRVNLANVPIVARFINSLDRVDYDFQDEVLREDGALHVNRLLSDDFLTKYLLHGNSFICWLEIDGLKVDRRFLEGAGAPGKYLVDSNFNGPVIMENGLMADYKVSGHKDAPLLETDPVIIQKFRFETTDWQNSDWVTAARNPVGKREYARAFHLRITN